VRLKNSPNTLKSTTEDVLLGDNGTMRLVQGTGQRVTGLVLDAGRIENSQFKGQKA